MNPIFTAKNETIIAEIHAAARFISTYILVSHIHTYVLIYGNDLSLCPHTLRTIWKSDCVYRIDIIFRKNLLDVSVSMSKLYFCQFCLQIFLFFLISFMANVIWYTHFGLVW